jgi:hypothetical protein
VVLCCYRCNQKKNDKTPSEAGMKLLRQPFKPKLDTTRIDLRRAPRSWNLVLPKDFDHLMSEAYWSVELK